MLFFLKPINLFKVNWLKYFHLVIIIQRKDLKYSCYFVRLYSLIQEILDYEILTNSR